MSGCPQYLKTLSTVLPPHQKVVGRSLIAADDLAVAARLWLWKTNDGRSDFLRRDPKSPSQMVTSLPSSRNRCQFIPLLKAIAGVKHHPKFFTALWERNQARENGFPVADSARQVHSPVDHLNHITCSETRRCQNVPAEIARIFVDGTGPYGCSFTVDAQAYDLVDTAIKDKQPAMVPSDWVLKTLVISSRPPRLEYPLRRIDLDAQVGTCRRLCRRLNAQKGLIRFGVHRIHSQDSVWVLLRRLSGH